MAEARGQPVHPGTHLWSVDDTPARRHDRRSATVASYSRKTGGGFPLAPASFSQRAFHASMLVGVYIV